ncbi:hypothetical protein B0O99DRAFT_692455 [Bisporella sp. PMI_857]|nr:hypothetical protein B0O99DRAFT_692455 [Bisporella sp. PMI_857]
MASKTAPNLQKYFPDNNSSAQNFTQQVNTSVGAITERERLQKDESQRQCLTVSTNSPHCVGSELQFEGNIKQCLSPATDWTHRAQTNVFENVIAAQGSQQVIISTSGVLISATTVTAEMGATQFLGQMSDSTLLQLSNLKA